MTRRQRDQFLTSAIISRTSADEQQADSRPDHRYEGNVDLGFAPGFCHQNLPAKGASRRLHVAQLALRIGRMGIRQHSDDGRLRNQLIQQFQALWIQRGRGKAHAGDVADRPIETGDVAGFDRIATGDKNDRNRGGRGPDRREYRAVTDDGGHLTAYEIGREPGSRSSWPSAQRNSTATFRPSMKPAWFSPRRNAATWSADVAATLLSRYPTTGTAGCCARRQVATRRRRRRAARTRVVAIVAWVCPLALCSLDQLVCAGEQRLRNVQADRLGSLEVDHQLELGRELHRQIGDLGAAQKAVDIGGARRYLSSWFSGYANIPPAVTLTRLEIAGSRCCAARVIVSRMAVASGGGSTRRPPFGAAANVSIARTMPNRIANRHLDGLYAERRRCCLDQGHVSWGGWRQVGIEEDSRPWSGAAQPCAYRKRHPYDLATESPNVIGDGRPVSFLADAVHLASSRRSNREAGWRQRTPYLGIS